MSRYLAFDYCVCDYSFTDISKKAVLQAADQITTIGTDDSAMISQHTNVPREGYARRCDCGGMCRGSHYVAATALLLLQTAQRRQAALGVGEGRARKPGGAALGITVCTTFHSDLGSNTGHRHR